MKPSSFDHVNTKLDILYSTATGPDGVCIQTPLFLVVEMENTKVKEN